MARFRSALEYARIRRSVSMQIRRQNGARKTLSGLVKRLERMRPRLLFRRRGRLRSSQVELVSDKLYRADDDDDEQNHG